MLNREKLIRQRAEAFNESRSNPCLIDPTQEDMLEEIEIGGLQAAKDPHLEDMYLEEAFEGFGQGN